MYYLLALTFDSCRPKTGLRRRDLHAGPPAQPELHLRAQRQPRPGRGKGGQRRRLFPSTAPNTLTHLVQYQRIGPKPKVPGHPTSHSLHSYTPLSRHRHSASGPRPIPKNGIGQPLFVRGKELQTRIRLMSANINICPTSVIYVCICAVVRMVLIA